MSVDYVVPPSNMERYNWLETPSLTHPSRKFNARVMFLSCASIMRKKNTKFKTIFDCHWQLFVCVMKRHQYQVQFPAVDVLIKLVEGVCKNLN